MNGPMIKMPSGVMAALRPIMVSSTFAASKRSVSSGKVKPSVTSNTVTHAMAPIRLCQRIVEGAV